MILASADSSLKAGMLRTLKARIDRIVHYSSVYDAAMRRHHQEVRSRRKSTYAKIMAAVTLRATGGTIRGFAAWIRCLGIRGLAVYPLNRRTSNRVLDSILVFQQSWLD